MAGLILFIGANISWSVVSRWQAREKSCKMIGMIFFQMEQLTDIGGKSRSTVLSLTGWGIKGNTMPLFISTTHHLAMSTKMEPHIDPMMGKM